MRPLFLTAALLASCSFRVLPGPSPQGSGPLALRYEKSRLFFHSQDEARPDRIFAVRGSVLAQVSEPTQGLFVSRDAGASWSIAPLPDAVREIVADGPRLYARAQRTLWRSNDAGATWSLALTGGNDVEAVFAARDGGLYAAAASRVYVPGEGGHGLRALAIQGAEAPRFRSVAGEGRTLFASVRAPASRDLLAAIRSLLDGQTKDTDAALDAQQAVGFGGGMIYLSHDGGALWKKSALGLDAWLVSLPDAVYAVAADPLLEAAALARQNPGLARALAGQLHDQRVDADELRASHAWPGREALLKGTLALVFRSTDGGESWSRIAQPPPAVRIEVARQRAAFPVEAGSAAQAPRLPPARQQRQQRQRTEQQPPPPAPPPQAPHVTDEVLLSFLDPLRLLARQNHAPLLGFAAAGSEVWAYAPTSEQWTTLVAAIAAGTALEGEITLGAVAKIAGPAAELLRSIDGGATFAEVPGLPAFSPTSIAAQPGAAYLTLRGHGAARIVP